MSKNGTNCCSANNVDRTNEVYVLKDTGRFAYHNWQNELQGEAAPDSVAVNRPERAARSQGAKGGDKKKEAAIREIFEETGINKKDLEVIKPLIPTHDNVKVRGNNFVKESSWYLIRFLGDSKSKMMPEKKEGITKCKWLTPSEIVLIMKDSRPLVHYLLEFVLQDSDYKNFRKNTK